MASADLLARWEPVIGLEIHVQLATRSKIFCAAPAGGADQPNTHVDPLTLGMPGVLPVLNREAVELAMRLGLALGCHIDQRSRFARKHYFYPDLPKGYQISQYEAPICVGGQLIADVDGQEQVFRLHRIHLEEDAGKTVHDAQRGRSYVDYNRAGVALVETVSEPDMRSADDAVAYMKALHQIVVALNVSDGNMEQGNFRCDANVSLRPRGATALGTKVELKNINSFRFVHRAIEHEIGRQAAVLEGGGAVVQETRLWDEAAGVTRSMRTKEEAHDYRYFPDPDLMDVVIDDAWLERVRRGLPELPRDRRRRFEDAWGLSRYDADLLTQARPRADYFEAVVAAGADPKVAANWVCGELLAALNRDGRDLPEDLEAAPVAPGALADLLALVARGTISGKMGKDCFQAMYAEGVAPAAWVARHGGQISDTAAIDAAVAEAVAAHPAEAAQARAGKTKLVGFFVGQVMKATGGKANPQLVNAAVRRALEPTE